MSMPLTIEIQKDGEPLDVHTFEQGIIKIGRLPSAHLRLEDSRVSRIHAVVEAAPEGGLSITDMGSAEGTYVNGNQITKAAIADGDEITLGTTKLIVRLGAAAATATHQPMPAQGEGGYHAEAPPGVMQVPEEARYDIRGFIEGRVDPSPVPDSENRAIELRFMWGQVLLDVSHIKHQKPVTIGESRKSNFFLTSEDFPVPEFPLIFHEGEYQLNITPKMEGVIRLGERTCTLVEVVKQRLATQHPTLDDTYTIRLTPEVRAAIQFGGVTVLIRSVTPSRPVIAPFGSQINYNFLNSFLFSSFLHLALLITAVNYPYDTRLLDDDIFTTPNRFTTWILTPPEPPQPNPLLKRLKGKDSAAEAEKHKGDEGKAGIKEMLEKDARAAPKAIDPTDEQLVSQVFERIRGGSSGLATVFDESGLGGDIEGALGGLIGSVVGDAGGAGGLGLKGVAGGGGGLSGSTIGMGGIGTRGRAGGFGGYGKGVHGLAPRREAAINISEGDPIIRGALDRELIRRVIHANRAQVRYCYEVELQRTSDLHGRIAVRFTIAANGTVTAASVDQNTMGNPNVANCLVSRLRTWQFPEPKGGGIVIVTYPFVFQQAGQ